MPGLNGRGPSGEGPKTGRSLGRCGRSNRDSITDTDSTFQAPLGAARRQGQRDGTGAGLGRGRGRRRGGGRGRM